MEMFDHANLAAFFKPPFAEREKEPSDSCIFILLKAGIEPGPPALKVTTLSQLPLSFINHFYSRRDRDHRDRAVDQPRSGLKTRQRLHQEVRKFPYRRETPDSVFLLS